MPAPRPHDAAWSEMPLELLGQVAMSLAKPHTPGAEVVCRVSRHWSQVTEHLDGVAHLTLSDTINGDKIIQHGTWTPEQWPSTRQPPPPPAAPLAQRVTIEDELEVNMLLADACLNAAAATAGEDMATTDLPGLKVLLAPAAFNDEGFFEPEEPAVTDTAADEGGPAADVPGLNMHPADAGLNAEGSFGPAEAMAADAAAAADDDSDDNLEVQKGEEEEEDAPLGDHPDYKAEAAAAAARRQARVPAVAAWLRRHSPALRGLTITFSGYDDSARVLGALQGAAQAALDAGAPLPLSELHLKDKSVTSRSLGDMLCMLPRMRRLELTGTAGSMSGFDAPALGGQLTMLSRLKSLRELHLGCYMPGLCFTRQMSAVLPAGLTSLAVVLDRAAVNANRQLDHLVNLVCLTMLDAPAAGGFGGGGGAAFEDLLEDGKAIAALPSLKHLSVGAHSVGAAAMKRLAPVLASLAHVGSDAAHQEGLTNLTALTALTLLAGTLEGSLPSLVAMQHLQLSILDEPHLSRALGALGQLQQLRSLDLVKAPRLTAATNSSDFTALASLTRLKLTRATHITEEGQAAGGSSSTWGDALSQAQQLRELEVDGALLATQQPVLTSIVCLTRLVLHQPVRVGVYNPATSTSKMAISRLPASVVAEVVGLRGQLQVVEVVGVGGGSSAVDGEKVQRQLVKVLPPSCQVVV